MVRTRWMWGTLAVLAGTLATGAFFAASGLSEATTAALRRAGFDNAVASVTAIGLADDRPALRFDLAIDLGDLRGAGEAFGLPLDGQARLSGALAVGWSGWSVVVAPVGCLAIAVEDLSVSGEAIRLPDGATLCEIDGTPVLRWATDGAVTVMGDLRAKRVDLPARDLRADGVEVALSQSTLEQAADLRVVALRRTVTPVDITPLAVVGRAVQTVNEPWRFTATATGAQGLLTATLTGSHDTASGEGSADVRTKPLRLVPKGPGLKALSPLLAGLIADSAGSVTAKASLTWGASGLRSKGRILLEKFAGRVGPVAIAGVNGTIALSSLSPLVIPDGQTLAVALLDVGVPLTDGLVRFGYGRDGRIDVDEAVWRWGGGTVRANPFELAPTAPKGLVTLHAEGVDLAKILALVSVEGIEATGILSGTLPVRIDGARVSLDGGVLEAVGAGTLRYDPAHPPTALKGEEGSAGDLLLGALTDFRFESLRLTIDGEAGGELRAALSVRGANPTFYDGYPVALNLKLSGALDRILRQSLDAYRIPDAVLKGMTGFDQKDP